MRKEGLLSALVSVNPEGLLDIVLLRVTLKCPLNTALLSNTVQIIVLLLKLKRITINILMNRKTWTLI